MGSPKPAPLGTPQRVIARPSSPMEGRHVAKAGSTTDARQTMPQWREQVAYVPPRPIPEPPREDHLLHRRRLGQSPFVTEPKADSPSLLCPTLCKDVDVTTVGAKVGVHPTMIRSSESSSLSLERRHKDISEKLQAAELRLTTLQARAVNPNQALALEQSAAKVNGSIRRCEAEIDALGQREQLLKHEEANAMHDVALSGAVPGRGPVAEELAARNSKLQCRVDDLEDECAALKQACLTANEDAAEKVHEMKAALAQELARNDKQLSICEEEVASYSRSGVEVREECRREIEKLRGELTTAEQAAWKEAAETEHWGREAAQVKRGIEAERRQLLAQLDFVRQRVMESRQESKKIEMEDDQAKSRLHDVQESIKESQSLITVAHEECIQAAHESRHVRSEAIDLEAQQRHLEEAWQSISRDGARRIASLEGEAQELRQTVTNAENGFLERSDGPALIDGSVARQELWEVDRRIQNSQQGLNDALLQLQHQGSQLRDWQHRFESGAEPEPEGGATNGAILGENPANALQEELQRGRKELEALQEHAAHCRAEASAADAAASSAMGDLHFLESRSYGANGSKVTAAREQQLEAEVQLVRDQLEFAATEKERVQKDLQVAMKKLNGARSNPSRSVGGVPKLPPPERLT